MKPKHLEGWVGLVLNLLAYLASTRRGSDSIAPKGPRQSVPAPSFVWGLKTGEIPERVVKAIDGNRRNLRFDNLELATTAEERFKERRNVWLAWCHSSEEEKIEWLKTKPQPSPPRWIE